MDSEENRQPSLDNSFPVIEHRYRTSKYFLEDQLRCSDAVQDFRSVKELLDGSSSFNFKHSFQFATAAIPIPKNQKNLY